MPQNFLNNPPKNLFFTGKGGVGKTTTSAATALTLADTGKNVLLVSTDPASNLDEVLGLSLSAEPAPVPGIAGLFAANVDPVEAAAAYREKMVGPYRGILPEAAVRSMEEQLSGACTVEIAAFNEFARLMGNPDAAAGFDHIIFDTAPTGHTLRLLSPPGRLERLHRHQLRWHLLPWPSGWFESAASTLRNHPQGIGRPCTDYGRRCQPAR